jgi:preprotein translocase subunit SecG
METILIVIHLLIVVALVGVVLMQRSEGGGLGIGGGSGFMTARGAANALTRTTAILAAAFFATSLALALLSRYGERPIDILDRLPAQQGAPATGSGGVLDQLGGSTTPPAGGTQTQQPPSGEATQPAAPANGAAAPQPAAPAAPAADGTQPATGTGQGGPQIPNQ